jgi:hypothetical protein
MAVELAAAVMNTPLLLLLDCELPAPLRAILSPSCAS